MRRLIKMGSRYFAMLALAFLLLSNGADAMNFDLGDGIKLDWDTTLRYTLAQRVANQSDRLLADPNTDDGDRNFDKGSLIKNRFDVITEADLNLGQTGFLDNLGFFARARAWYDFVYNQDNDNDSPMTSNNAYKGNFLYTGEDYNKFDDDTEKWHGKNAEMLDYFLYTSFEVAGHKTALRVGQQALNWGETLFLVGGVMSSQGPIDATGFNQPGVELKELFLPVEQATVQTDLTKSLSFEAYYQWEWEPYRLDAAGSYFSTYDFMDEGGRSFILVPGAVSAMRSADEDPSDNGQWGVNIHYVADALAGTDFGLYYINYHDQLPMVIFDNIVDLGGVGNPEDFAPLSYHLKYAEDIHLYAASFSTVVFDTNVAGEVAYRKKVPVEYDDGSGLPAYRKGEIIHYSLSGIYLFPTNSFTDGIELDAEVGADQVLDYKSDLVGDEWAWGYSFTLTPTWLSVLPGVDVKLPLSLAQGVSGNSALAASFVERADTFGITLELTVDNKYEVQFSYVDFFGGDAYNALNDRDYVSMNIKYSF